MESSPTSESDWSLTLPEALRGYRAIQVLERSLARDRLGHGILLHGESLAALEQVARSIAARLLRSGSDPFGHPDCFTLRPRGRARAISIGRADEKVGGDWPRNTMRRLVIDLHKSAHGGDRKVGVVFEADRMNRQAANAFLKTLEEPPPGTTLLLLTTRPYDLLDTIRSRCLNFRIPAKFETIDNPDWTAWVGDYRAWLVRLVEGPARAKVPDVVFRACGLNARFQAILKQMTDAQWSERKADLPEGATDEEAAALEAGLARGLRVRLLGEIEKATAAFARDLAAANPGEFPAPALARANGALEHAAGLLELNFNPGAALELFFLQSLRIWSAPY